MIKKRISAAVYGMLHYYGVMPMADVFVLSYRCGLCGLPDYSFFHQRIQADLIHQQQIYAYKDCLCHKWVRNPAVIEQVQQERVAMGYKRFSLQAYLDAGKEEMIWSEPFCGLEDFLKAHTAVPIAGIRSELVRVWREISNMCDLVGLTAQCVENLSLPWRPEESAYMRVLQELQSVAAQMPQWHCKGYSYAELAEREKEKEALC